MREILLSVIQTGLTFERSIYMIHYISLIPLFGIIALNIEQQL